jgi:signal transduction protein with GAF and PtsI domain
MLEEMFAAFYKIADHLSKGDKVEETLARTVEFATVFLNCDECCTYVRQGHELLPSVGKHVKHGSLDGTPLPIDSGFAASVGVQCAPIAVSADSTEGDAFKVFAEWSRDPGETFVCAPLLSRSQLVGVITLRHWRPRRYALYEFEFLSSIGYMLGAQLAIARLEEENAGLLLELETRKLVERSKGILQRDMGMSERQAHLALQRESQQRKRPLKDIAQAVILSAEMRQNIIRRKTNQGAVAKWQGKGLQNPHRRFDSAPRLQGPTAPARDWPRATEPLLTLPAQGGPMTLAGSGADD